jgi:hypothetical protein
MSASWNAGGDLGADELPFGCEWTPMECGSRVAGRLGTKGGCRTCQAPGITRRPAAGPGRRLASLDVQQPDRVDA